MGFSAENGGDLRVGILFVCFAVHFDKSVDKGVSKGAYGYLHRLYGIVADTGAVFVHFPAQIGRIYHKADPRLMIRQTRYMRSNKHVHFGTVNAVSLYPVFNLKSFR